MSKIDDTLEVLKESYNTLLCETSALEDDFITYTDLTDKLAKLIAEFEAVEGE